MEVKRQFSTSRKILQSAVDTGWSCGLTYNNRQTTVVALVKVKFILILWIALALAVVFVTLPVVFVQIQDHLPGPFSLLKLK